MHDDCFGLSSVVQLGQILYQGFADTVSVVHELGVIEPSVHEDRDGKPEHEYPAHNVADHMHIVRLAMRNRTMIARWNALCPCFAETRSPIARARSTRARPDRLHSPYARGGNTAI